MTVLVAGDHRDRRPRMFARHLRALRASRQRQMFSSKVTRRILALCNAAELITICAWCKRVKIDRKWLLPPLEALTAINAPSVLSHGICPGCAAGGSAPRPGLREE
jgi:hypothetical protein